MPCSFKSSVGRRLSKLLALDHIDTDIEIENKTGRTIADIIADGQTVFRDIESKIIAKLPNKPCVISTGGGVVERENNMKMLSQGSTVIWLKTSPNVLYHRLNNSNTRPLASSLTLPQLTAYASKRDSLYCQYANITISTDNVTSVSLANKLHAMLTQQD